MNISNRISWLAVAALTAFAAVLTACMMTRAMPSFLKKRTRL